MLTVYTNSIFTKLIRQLIVEFSYTTFVDEVRTLVKTGSGITSIADLNGESVVTVASTSEVQTLNDYLTANGLNITVELAASEEEAFNMLETDQVAGFVYETITLSYYAAQCSGGCEIVGETLDYVPSSVFYRKDDPKFAYVVNQAVLKVIKSGLIRSLYEKWLLEPIPTDGVIIGLPVSKQTEFAWTDLNTLPAEVFPLAS